MYLGNEQLKWAVRCTLAAVNKTLSHIINIETLKTWHAGYYLKRDIDLKCPKKLNEKILYLSYHTDTTQWSQLADKYEVRQYVKQKGLEEILVPNYGVYRSFEEIDFERLPEKFVLKATHGCDMNYICTDKSRMNLKEVRKKVNFWLHHNLAYMALEPHYARITPRVLCEKYLENSGDIIDYKFFCCDGQARFVEVCSERAKGPYLDIFTLDWKPWKNVIVGAKNNPNGLQKPQQFERMIEIANKLAEGFPFVRVDLYEIENHIYFGEMTFTPATGVLFHFSDEFLLEQGAYCTIKNC